MLADGRKTPPVQVATGLGTSIVQCKLEWDTVTICNLHMDTNKIYSCVPVQVTLLLHPIPGCTS